MLSWREIPYFRVAIVFIGGILLGRVVSIELYPLIGIVLLLLIGFFYLNQKRYIFVRRSTQGLLLLCLFFVLGTIRYELNDPRRNLSHISWKNAQSQYVLGVIQDKSKRKSSFRYTLKVEYVGSDSLIMRPASGQILMYHPLKDETNYQLGDRIIIFGSIQVIPLNTNPYAFDYKAFLEDRKIYNQIFTRKHRLIDQNNLPFLDHWANILRNGAIKILERYLDDKEHLAIASAMILGYKDYISEELYDAYTDSGAVHVLAVSGLHVGILAGFLFFILSKWSSSSWWVRFAKVCLIAICIWTYVLVTGAAPAVVRAGLMFTIWLIGKNFFETADLFNILSFSAFCLLLVNPYMLFQLSFQLSFIALLSLAYFFPIIKNLWIPRAYLMDKIWQLIAVSIAAQILIAPLIIYYFHKFPVYFMLSGLVAVPMASIILILGLSLLFVELICPLINFVVAAIFKFFLGFFVKSIYWIQAMPGSTFDDLWLEETYIILIYAGIFCLIGLLRYRHKAFIYLSITLIVSGLYFDHWKSQNKGHYAIHIYDVNRNTVIDFVDHSTCYSYTSEELPQGSDKFIYYNNRLRNEIKEIVSISADNPFNGKGFAYRDGMVQLGYRLLVLGSQVHIEQLTEIGEIDILILDDKVNEGLETALSSTHLNLVVINNSISIYYQKKYKSLCKKYNIPCHVIREHGAFSTFYN